jgi:hypothetical protein
MSAKDQSRALGIVALVSLLTGAASAQSVTDAQQSTFDHMTRAPVDHENTFAYVRASVEARDFEGAIAALERILTYNPRLTRAKYELGVLYFRLHSYEQAVMYFEDALADPALEPNLARRIEGFLPEARKQLDKNRLSGVFQFGFRYNSNVAGVPGSDVVRSFGIDVVSRRPFPKQDDGSAFALGNVKHVYDFENQRGDAWETNFAGYGALQFNLNTLNVGLVDLNTGPRLALAPDALPGWTIRPFASVGGSMIYDRRYSTSYGGGVSFGVPIAPFLSLEPGFEGRRVEVNSFGGLPNQGVLATGVLWTGALAATWSVSDDLSLNGRVFGGRNAADPGGVSSDHVGFESSLKIDFAPPSEEIGMKWSVTPFVRYLLVDFGRADPVVDPFIVRQDRQFRIGAQLDMPITPMFGVNASAQYDGHESNIRNFRASGGTFLLGPTIRF